MSVTCITCTSDRPWAMARAEFQMARQTLPWDEWIVADDGVTPAKLTLGQRHLRLPPQPRGEASLAHNLRAAVRAANGEHLVIIEDDDWYHPEYLATCLRRLAEVPVAGEPLLRYYHVRKRCYATFPNAGGSGLFQTSFRREVVPTFLRAVNRALASGSYDIDGRFWRALAPDQCRLYEERQTVGIKGMPGKAGLGIGHRPGVVRRRGVRPCRWQPPDESLGEPWILDPNGHQLRTWIGEDANYYLAFTDGDYSDSP